MFDGQIRDIVVHPPDAEHETILARVRRPKSALHQDEVAAVESFRQTIHKLALVRDYGGKCCGIVAQRSRKMQKVLDITLADVYAGAGQHKSAVDPDGVSKGSALLLATIAREIQRSHALVHARVRLNDKDSAVAKRLDTRVEHYRRGASPSDRVDIRVDSRDAAEEALLVAKEAAQRHGFLLLLVDAFGMPPDFSVLDEVARTAGWHEMLINLDVSDMFRLRAVAQMNVTQHEKLSRADEALLNRVFGDTSWKGPYGNTSSWTHEALEELALTYANRFSRHYSERGVYRLWSTGNQIRFFVHLANHSKATTSFRECYEKSQRSGLFQGRSLSEADRARYALDLFEKLRGAETTIDEIAASGVVALDRGRIRDVLKTAEDRGLGLFGEAGFQWFEERTTPEPFKPAQLEFGLGA
jgi:three-Cys-motif partner protein